MRKNENKFKATGYVYDVSKLKLKVTGPTSAHPGTEYISGVLSIATDEEGLEIVKVNYVFETYNKDAKSDNRGAMARNANFTLLKQLIDEHNAHIETGAPEKTWVASGKDAAYKVSINSSIKLNDYVNSTDEQMVSVRQISGGFISFAKPNAPCGNSFVADMLINKVTRVEANPDNGENEDYCTINGAIFGYNGAIFPMSFIVRNPDGMKYFEDADISKRNKMYTQVTGCLKNRVIVSPKEDEVAWGEPSVTEVTKNKTEWLVVKSAKTPFDFGEDMVMTEDDVTAALNAREEYLATKMAEHKNYLAKKAETVPFTEDDDNEDW